MSEERITEEHISQIRLSVRLPSENHYHLERLRLAMDVKTKDEAISRAFKEFAEQHGVEFSQTPVNYDLLESTGFEAPGNTALLARTQGTFVLWLPDPTAENWLQVLKENCGCTSITEVMLKALNAAQQKYVR
jgi:NAD-specific glutamate dehydrogenase